MFYSRQHHSTPLDALLNIIVIKNFALPFTPETVFFYLNTHLFSIPVY